MRRQRQPSRRAPKTLFRAHQPDSDESISDDDVFPNNAPSLHPTNKQELPLLVRLDILKGISNQNLNGKGNTSSFEKPLEDEVEMPDFNEGEVVANSTDEENNSADGVLIKVHIEYFSSDLSAIYSVISINLVIEVKLAPLILLQKYGPRSIRNEQVRNRNRISEVLLHSKESASASHATYSKANTSGIKKAKPRFSLASVLCKSGGIDHSISNIESFPEIIKAVDPRASANLDGNHLDDDDRIEINSDIEPAETEALPHEFNMAPIADLFDNLQDKAHQETVIDSEDSPESVDSESSSDKEVSDQHMKITFPGKKMQTIAERFEEALGTSSVITEGTHVGAPNSLRPGIFGKLQHMMLKVKETDMEFWKKLQPEARPDGELGCIDVKIISRYRDGKLTVCHCSFGKYTENFLLQDNSKGMRFGGSECSQSTIIFSPRVCNNVDLEVGSLIRIHPPWFWFLDRKEVQAGNDNVILCTYFSEILFPV
ncbi:hypothetical protein GLYMA_13G007800v4 [Glycine max]|uniref:uncharacterized protein isoform X1 n=2 Tax=Glycine max TaxID=3847 RepID=UPI0007191394|nr:uncharacterized protein LOC100796411 isoform X1 [Glycine max]KAH1099432.1 hypothetical protein GYH30_034874 [Glycine max]KRH17681.2 hypothetical protein GLYMA_13G007800v4 [Glycine max]|eukprot:XP_014621866.1 uncharacterized protein LOC100796411 isoform X2 [Glycine max]